MEWLDQGTYRYETQHPPLARVTAALGPYLAGVRSTNHPDMWREGNEILHSGSTYARNLTLLRVGILPFFILASVLVWSWAKRLFGPWAAAAATFLFTNVPSVLAHAGVATTDMAATATLLAAVYAFSVWQGEPTAPRAVALGFAVGGAVLTKFSLVLFLPICGVAVLLARMTAGRPSLTDVLAAMRRRFQSLPVAGAVTLLVIWAGYRFSLAPITGPESRPHHLVSRVLGNQGPLHDAASRIVEFPIPAPELFRGLVWLWNHVEAGHDAYLFGEYRDSGWWYFFPVVLAVKTPLPLLILAASGLVFLVWRRTQRPSWETFVPVYAAAGILIACSVSTISLGVRHILPIYPLLAMTGGFAVVKLTSFRRWGRVVVTLLLFWQAFSAAVAHPHYLAYFNELAGSEPERILVESDLDWGQDLGLLAKALRERGVKEVTLGYFGSADITRHDLPRVRPLMPDQPAAGWIAVSLSVLKMHGAKLRQTMPGALSWLDNYRPVARIGKSFLLYYIPRLP